MTTQLTLNQICDVLVEYVANNITTWEVAEKVNKGEDAVRNVISKLQQEWDEMPCDPEGETKEQKEDMDKLLELYARELLAL